MSHSVSIERIVEALRGYRIGDHWQCHCPAHDDRTPSLTVSKSPEGVTLVYCHAGCSQADIIAALNDRGLWKSCSLPKHQSVVRLPLSEAQRKHAETKRRTADALRIWCTAVPADGSLVQTYLSGRGIKVALSSQIKFVRRLRHRSGASYPTMVALVTTGLDNRPIGIHRTWLAVDGREKAPVSPNKMMLGPCKGGAVRLSPFGQPLLIGEGIETTLSAMQATGWAGWAALSTSGMRGLQLPPEAANIVILADGDGPGREAAGAAAKRWVTEGQRVRIAQAPEGRDFNDVLRDRQAISLDDAS